MSRNKALPLSFTLFGATGDLAKTKIMPALAGLFRKNKLPAVLTIVAFSRRPWTDDDYRSFIRPELIKAGLSEDIVDRFLRHIVYVRGTFDDRTAYFDLKQKLDEIDSHILARTDAPAERIFHLAIQPEFYEAIITGLADVGLNATEAMEQPKILIEKPIGHDLDSAQELEMLLAAHFAEKQKYRVDHYLGKEGLQAVIVERSKDRNFDYRLSAQHVQEIRIRLWEADGIGDRGEFYESTGALRDVGQNHVLEMLAAVTMDIPAVLSADALAHARAAILRSLQPINGLNIDLSAKRAQYRGYRQEANVDKQSQTETYFWLRTEILTKRWRGAVITLEAGKLMPEKESDITVVYHDRTMRRFDIQRPISLERPDAYETLIELAIEGDKSHFVSSEELIASWKFITPILENFERVPLKTYKKEHDHRAPWTLSDFDRLDPRF